jgi:hypothetical protein
MPSLAFSAKFSRPQKFFEKNKMPQAHGFLKNYYEEAYFAFLPALRRCASGCMGACTWWSECVGSTPCTPEFFVFFFVAPLGVDVFGGIIFLIIHAHVQAQSRF